MRYSRIFTYLGFSQFSCFSVKANFHYNKFLIKFNSYFNNFFILSLTGADNNFKIYNFILTYANFLSLDFLLKNKKLINFFFNFFFLNFKYLLHLLFYSFLFIKSFIFEIFNVYLLLVNNFLFKLSNFFFWQFFKLLCYNKLFILFFFFNNLIFSNTLSLTSKEYKLFFLDLNSFIYLTYVSLLVNQQKILNIKILNLFYVFFFYTKLFEKSYISPDYPFFYFLNILHLSKYFIFFNKLNFVYLKKIDKNVNFILNFKTIFLLLFSRFTLIFYQNYFDFLFFCLYGSFFFKKKFFFVFQKITFLIDFVISDFTYFYLNFLKNNLVFLISRGFFLT